MTEVTKVLDRDAWLRRLEQEFYLDGTAGQALGKFLDLDVVSLKAVIKPSQAYHQKIITFRGSYEVGLRRTCVVSLEEFIEKLSGLFERSFTLSPSAPALPEGSEEAEEFPYSGVALLDLLGDEIALNASSFPRKSGAELPNYKLDEVEMEQRPNPFSILGVLKKG